MSEIRRQGGGFTIIELAIVLAYLQLWFAVYFVWPRAGQKDWRYAAGNLF